MQLEQEDLDKHNQRFGSKQNEDEHSLRIDRERAELEDCSAKRRCFNASTDDGITFRNLLAKDAEGASDAKGFEEKAREMSLGLEVHKASKEQITSNHRPLQFNTEAADAIAKFITESVAASSKHTARATVNTNLYDSPWISLHHLRQLPVNVVWQNATDNDSNVLYGIFPNDRECEVAVTIAYNCL